MKTDPKNCDYIVEKGATRHFEPWRDYQVSQALELKRQCAGDSLTQAEERTIDTQRDMDQKRDLGRLCAVSSKQSKVDVDAIRPEKEERELILTEVDRRKIEGFEEARKQQRTESTVELRTMKKVGLEWGKKSGWGDSEED
jgi:hypothetical protein